VGATLSRLRSLGYVTESYVASTVDELMHALSRAYRVPVELRVSRRLVPLLVSSVKASDLLIFVEGVSDDEVSVALASVTALLSFDEQVAARSAKVLADPVAVHRLLSVAVPASTGVASSPDDLLLILRRRSGLHLCFFTSDEHSSRAYVLVVSGRIYAAVYIDAFVYLGVSAVSLLFRRLPLWYVVYELSELPHETS
jgi:hypothetical protein